LEGLVTRTIALIPLTGKMALALHQFLPAIAQHAVRLYVRCTLSYRDVEDLLVELALDLLFCGVGNHVDLRGLPGGAEGIRTASPLCITSVIGSPCDPSE
jgi:hypothetical protein